MTAAVLTRALVVAVALLGAAPAFAQSVKLSGDDIRALLAGNTAIGRWNGERYRQFFGPDGITIYAQEGARSTRGMWRVDDEEQEYQSIWPRHEAWEGWFVMEYGGTFYWVSKKTPPTPFQVLGGQQLVVE